LILHNVEKHLLSEDSEAMSQPLATVSGNASAGTLSGRFPITREAISHWFAVYTATRHEKRVAQHIQQRGIECFLPLYQVPRKWRNGLRVTIELPLFPNYLFVRVDSSTRSCVLAIPGVLLLVGGRSPSPVPEAEIEWLRAGVNLGKFEPHPYPLTGQKVRIKSGCLAGLEGVLVRSNNRTRAVVTIEQIMRSVAVELENDELEIVSEESPVQPPIRDELRPGPSNSGYGSVLPATCFTGS
jgi:transcription antitermination factor NusG